MHDVDRAMAQISDIRDQLAATVLFRGLGPVVVGATGLLGIAAAIVQVLLPETLVGEVRIYLAYWIGVALICATTMGTEMSVRSRREHGGLGEAMAIKAARHFLPVGLAGAGLTMVLMQYAPDSLWSLPGTWQLFVALGVAGAAGSFLPRSMLILAAWYGMTGLVTLAVGSVDRTLTPWMMGVPFGGGQLLSAIILHLTNESRHG